MTPAGCIQLFSQMADSLEWGEPASLKKSLNEILSINAKAVIIVLFTGSEPPVPGDYDRKMAMGYAKLLELMKVELLDVVLVGDSEIVSMKCSGDFVSLREWDTPLAGWYVREDDFEDDVLIESLAEIPPNDDGL